MKRLTLLLAVAALTGCQTAGPTGPVINPFLGRATVPPPGTGSPAPLAAPYYGDGQLAPPNVQLPAPNAPGGGAPLTPPGSSYRYQGSSLDRPSQWRPGGEITQGPESEAPRFADKSNSDSQPVEQAAAREATDEENPSPVVRAAVEETVAEEVPPRVATPAVDDSTSTSHSVIRIIEPEQSTVATLPERESTVVRSAGWERQQSPGQIDREPSDRLASQARPKTSFAGFRGTTDAEVPSPQTSTTVASPANDARYGYEPNYTRLRGRLEYSHIDREWKLRYIPAGGIDGGTDAFGGSVVLPEVPELDRFESGDFVEIEGEPLPLETKNSGFAPKYDLRRIAALDR